MTAERVRFNDTEHWFDRWKTVEVAKALEFSVERAVNSQSADFNSKQNEFNSKSKHKINQTNEPLFICRVRLNFSSKWGSDSIKRIKCKLMKSQIY